MVERTLPRTLLDVERPSSWPAELHAYLDEYHDLFLAWETKPDRDSAQSFDTAIYGLRDVLKAYVILGWHCARLTDAEADNVRRGGMQLPSAEILTHRIDDLLDAELITHEIAQRLKSENRADDEFRAGMVWFCFFPLGHVDEYRIGRFFQHWGGEALYVCHEGDPVTSPVLKRLGTPRLVEAEVPIALLDPRGYPDRAIYRRFLISRGHRTTEPDDYEGYIVHPLPAENVKRIVSFPEPDFYSLTGCADWKHFALDPSDCNG